MKNLKFWAFACLLAAGAWRPGTLAAAKPLPAPQNLTVTVEDQGPEFFWSAVPGATCYRLAVFLEKDRRAPLAAVWIKGTRYLYGQDNFINKIGGLPSKAPSPLRKGSAYKWMVASAAAGGLRKSDWASGRFEYTAPKAKPTASATPTPMGGELTVSPESETPTATSEAATATVTPTPNGENVLKEESPSGDPSLERGQKMLKDKQWDAAIKEYKRLCDQDPKNFEAWSGLGDAYLGANMRVEAVESYRQALTLKDDEKIRAWLKENTRSY